MKIIAAKYFFSHVVLNCVMNKADING